MWQKIKHIRALHPFEEPFVNSTFWVKMQKPHFSGPVRNTLTGVISRSANVLESNILQRNGKPILINIEAGSFELLGGDDSFADDVPIITWEEFIKPKRKEREREE
jgi:hypothetical protein